MCGITCLGVAGVCFSFFYAMALDNEDKALLVAALLQLSRCIYSLTYHRWRWTSNVHLLVANGEGPSRLFIESRTSQCVPLLYNQLL